METNSSHGINIDPLDYNKWSKLTFWCFFCIGLLPLYFAVSIFMIFLIIVVPLTLFDVISGFPRSTFIFAGLATIYLGNKFNIQPRKRWEVELEVLAKKKAEEDAARKVAERERKKQEAANLTQMLEEIEEITRDYEVWLTSKREEFQLRYKEILSIVQSEEAVLRDLRYRHPRIAEFISSRAEGDSDAGVFAKLSKRV